MNGGCAGAFGRRPAVGHFQFPTRLCVEPHATELEEHTETAQPLVECRVHAIAGDVNEGARQSRQQFLEAEAVGEHVLRVAAFLDQRGQREYRRRHDDQRQRQRWPGDARRHQREWAASMHCGPDRQQRRRQQGHASAGRAETNGGPEQERQLQRERVLAAHGPDRGKLRQLIGEAGKAHDQQACGEDRRLSDPDPGHATNPTR